MWYRVPTTLLIIPISNNVNHWPYWFGCFGIYVRRAIMWAVPPVSLGNVSCSRLSISKNIRFYNSRGDILPLHVTN